MNTNLRTRAKNFQKDFFKLMNNSVFYKTMEKLREHRDIQLRATDKRRSQLMSEPNYRTTNRFSEDFIINRNKKDKNKNQ